ncbi:hypothetical protein [Micromonospora mirobrigensis]|uniref:Lipoprotein LprG n=1 Tax=Micromonospora mirobrigensis TaxID=262898 RepID=A0A1C4YAJ2_9ACTN|nr:hypothetical protein [Micromonospora mirobrigensis]SCF17680.1 hypothetical protein GA0070564_103674 [Micromonospora mirobrigensis]
MTYRTGATGPIRRIAITALTATALLAGCGGAGDRSSDATGSSAPTPSPSADPKAELLTAVPDGQDPRFRYTEQNGPDKLSGVVDPAAKAQELTFSQTSTDPDFTMALSMRVIADRSWMRVKLTGVDGLHEMMKLPKRWMTLDPAKLEGDSDPLSYEGSDPGNTGVFLEHASAVRKKGTGTYTGFLDLTAGAEVAEALDNLDLTASGAAAKKVPFTAVVGPDGNLASLSMTVPAAGKQKARKVVVRYFDFGKAPKLAAPAGDQVQAAPASAYEMLNS